MKEGGSLGFSIIGGTDHSCMPFGASEPGIFISHVSTLCSGELKKLIFISGLPADHFPALRFWNDEKDEALCVRNGSFNGTQWNFF